MNKYNGLDKMSDEEIKLLKFVKTYKGVKIYLCETSDHPTCVEGFVVISRKYLIDCSLGSLQMAKNVVDHFHEPMAMGH